MITYVNTVFVSNNSTATLLTAENLASIDASNVNTYKGRFLVYDIDNGTYSTSSSTARFKIGMITGAITYDHMGVAHPVIKWSNIINCADIKSIATLEYAADTEDVVTIDFTGMSQDVLDVLAQGGKRVITRLTFKDLPTRYRKWTESYEYVTAAGDDADAIATGIANLINKQWKRARVTANAASGVLTLTAMKYDDDNSVDSISWYNKVRFNANLYYTDPAADGWESLNKHFPTGVTIEKTPGSTYPGSPKLVRDREAQGMGYEGILNRGDGTWPVIKPAMETDLNGEYNVLTLEFENMYRAADDIFRKTKQAVEIYTTAATSTLVSAIKHTNLVRTKVDSATEHADLD